MTFFYDLNKKLDSIRETPEVKHQQLNERDMSRAAKGYEKYGKQGMEALAKAGREGKSLDPVRKKYNKYDEGVTGAAVGAGLGSLAAGPLGGAAGAALGHYAEKGYDADQTAKEGIGDMARKVGKMAKKVGGKVLDKLGHGDDAEMLRDLQRKMGVPKQHQHGKPGMAKSNEDYGPMESEGGKPMTPKQKSFAKLAPPADKITFADKIAGAKKEVDEVLGDVAATAMKKAISGHGSNKKPAADEGRIDDLMDKRREAGKLRQAEKPRARFVAGKAYGGSAQKDEPEHDDEEQAKSDQPKKRGRPAGTGRKIGAKGPTSRSKLAYGESDDMMADQDPGEYDREGEMATQQLRTAKEASSELQSILDADENLPEWVQKKITMAVDYLDTARDYMKSKEVDEEKTTKRDNRAEKAGKKVTKDIEYDEKKKDGIHGKKRDSEDDKAEKAGKKVAKDIEYDEKKKKKEKVKEETPETPAKGSAGFAYGKGIYDSMNREVESMIAESMSVNMSNSTEGGRSLTITATDDDAVQLAKMLKAAGLGGHDMGGESESCPSCGMNDCGCGDVHEAVGEAYGDTDETLNKPNWPTDTETSADALQYSGGLNKPKTTIDGDGQTTVPVTAVQMREDEELDEDKNCKACDCDPCECDESVAESFEQTLGRMREIAGIKEAKKPDFLDMDKDGDKEEPMKKAIKDKEKKVDESIFALTNQWKAYKG